MLTCWRKQLIGESEREGRMGRRWVEMVEVRE